MSKKVILFGPEKEVPSWNWVGFDTSRELTKYFDVKSYASIKSPSAGDAAVIIKQLPERSFIEGAKRRKMKLIYCPIDFFTSRTHMQQCSHVLQDMDCIVSHCERLNPLLRIYNSKVYYVDHNNKYALPEMATYKKNGYVLWIGGCQYTSYLMRWLKLHPIKEEVKILTDIHNHRAAYNANKLARTLGLDFKIDSHTKSVENCEVHEWSERLQYEMMTECKAAIDIKGEEDFNQKHKPATKAQKFVASGIPFAINVGSYSTEFFLNRGFNVCSPLNQDRWFSEKYWEETHEYGLKLKKETSIESVGLQFKDIINRTF